MINLTKDKIICSNTSAISTAFVYIRLYRLPLIQPTENARSTAFSYSICLYHFPPIHLTENTHSTPFVYI